MKDNASMRASLREKCRFAKNDQSRPKKTWMVDVDGPTKLLKPCRGIFCRAFPLLEWYRDGFEPASASISGGGIASEVPGDAGGTRTGGDARAGGSRKTWPAKRGLFEWEFE
jgi:hypothetical protein